MDFKDFKRLYDERKGSSKGFGFINDIFAEVRAEFMEEARRLVRTPTSPGTRGAAGLFKR